MATPTIADYLKYANLQMAAEAFLAYDNGQLLEDDKIAQALIDGNRHASKFTATQADDFVAHWKVVSQKPNTATGFSGTLFQCIQDDPATGAKKGELVLSMRSTEFIDDAVRDSAATNTLEVFKTGWAWGQISDMEAWYAELKSNGSIPAGSQLSVTGYSLGGHLATAFNRLHPDAAQQVVTFNGAGVGEIKAGNTLQSLLNDFNNLRQSPSLIKTKLDLTQDALTTYYDELRQKFVIDKTWTARQALDALLTRRSNATHPDIFEKEMQPLKKALEDILALQNEAKRISGFLADVVKGLTGFEIDLLHDKDLGDEDRAVGTPEARVNWRSASHLPENPIFTNLSECMQLGSFIHTPSSGIAPDEFRAIAANDRIGRMTA